MLRSFLVFLFIITVSHPGLAQEFPFIHFPDKTGGQGEVLAFEQNNNKEIHYVTPEGLYSFNSRYTTRILQFSALQLSGIRQAVFAPAKLYVLAAEGLFSIDLKDGQKVKTGLEGVDKMFYHAGQDHLYASVDGSLLRLVEKDSISRVLSGLTDVREMLFGEKEYHLLGKESVRVYNPDWTLKEKVKVEGPVIDSYLSNGKLWILTPSGIFTKEEESRGIKKYQSLSIESASCILEDKAGGIWVGTENNGVLLIDGNHRKFLGQENNFALKGVKGIYESKDFSLWFYGGNGIVLKPFSSPFRKFRLGSHIAGNTVQDIKELGPQKVGVLTGDGYFHHIENEAIISSTQIPLHFKPDFSNIIDGKTTFHVGRSGKFLLHTHQQNFWGSINKKIIKVFTFEEQSILVAKDGSTYLYHHRKHSLMKNKLVVDAEKTLFQAGSSLIYTDAAGNLKTWDSERGSYLAIGAYTPEMLHAALLNEKYIVFLSEDQQLKYSAEGKVVNLNFELGKSEKVSSFYISNSNLWISTEERLYQLSFYLKEGGLRLLEPKVFNVSDYDIQLPVLKSAINEEGSFWLASQKQVVLYNSFELAPDISRPGLVLEKIRLKKPDSVINVDLLQNDTIAISMERDDQLLINAFPVNYETKNKATLKYRILSGSERWNKPFEENFILLSHLGAGRHIIEVITENEQDVKSEKAVVLKVLVSKGKWFSGWAVFGGSLSLVLIGFFAVSGIKWMKDSSSREAKEKYEKELLKLQKRSHEQMMKAEGLKQVNELISAQKGELEDKNKQIVAQKYELTLTSNQIKLQKDVIEKTTEKLQSSINYAQRIQSALMADEIMIKEDLPDSFVFFKPRDQVSGDFFWFDKAKNEAGEEVLIIAAVDCTGHGVPGAIVSVVGIQLLNAIVKAKGITEPGKILTALNSDLLESLKYEQTKMNDGMDISLCTINLQQQKIYFAGAKNPLFIIENGELEVIKGDKYPIGGQKLREEKDFQTHEIVLKGDGKQMFYLFSDGYQDQFGGSGQSKFMVRNFKELLLEVCHKSMMEQKYLLGKTIKEWQGDEEQTDDILVLGFRI